jgi:hypothetical protein
MENKNKQPIIYKVLRIIAFTGIIVSVILFIIAFTINVPSMGAYNWFELSAKRSGMLFAGGAVMMISLFILFASFIPSIMKTQIKTHKYIINENEKDLKDISTKSADIYSEGLTKVAKSIKEGLTENTIFCKYCGKEIDANSQFCMHCGKNQKQ